MWYNLPEDPDHPMADEMTVIQPESEAGTGPGRGPGGKGRQGRGKLKIFLGAVAGVGKTTAMLMAARDCRAEGVDVLAGWVDTHGRPETESRQFLEALPHRRMVQRGVSYEEFNLDAALSRRPALILVDEFAHANVSGSRHANRWQDVSELLDAGIDVYSTLDIQHLESLADLVAKITGVVVRETIPDRVFDQADEIALVDLSPDEILRRVHEGKIFVPGLAQEALQNFFRQGNLIALRELALRRTADCVDAQMRAYMQDHAIQTTWPVTERIMACISPSPHAIRVVRAAKRFADALRAEWIAAFVETRTTSQMAEAERTRLSETLRLAEQLGAETVTLTGDRITEEILSHARSRNVSKIVVGKPGRPAWKRFFSDTIVDDLVRGSEEIDVYITTGEEASHLPFVAPRQTRRRAWPAYLRAGASVTLCTAVAWVMFPHFDLSNLIMVYLLGVIGMAVTTGPGPAGLAAILSVAAFDFFFVPPYFSFAVANTQYLVTFGVMLFVALVIGHLTTRIRWQAEAARQRERRTASLYALSRELAGICGVPGILQAAVRHIAEVFRTLVVVLLPDPAGVSRRNRIWPAASDLDENELAVGEWVYAHSQMAGVGTATLPDAKAPLSPAARLPRNAWRAGGTACVFPRARDPRSAAPAGDLCQPDRSGAGARAACRRGAALRDPGRDRADAQLLVKLGVPRFLTVGIHHRGRQQPAGDRRGARCPDEPGAPGDDLRGVGAAEPPRHQLLAMTRVESGALQLRTEWQPLEEIVGAVLARLKRRLADRPLTTRVPEDLPLVPLDEVLIEQVLINLLENALKYTPTATPSTLRLGRARRGSRWRWRIAGRGWAREKKGACSSKF